MSRSLRQVRSLPSLRASLHQSASSPKPSHLLSSTVQNRYQGLTVSALKSECRQRGLRLAGRKADLVDRLVAFETSKSFSTTKTSQEKGDASTIDYFRFPDGGKSSAAAEPKLKKPLFKIPVPPDASYSTAEIDAQYDVEAPAADASATPRGVHVVNGQSEVAAMNVDQGNVLDDSEAPTENNRTELPSRDKPILLALAGAIAAWWGSKFVTKSDNKH